MSRTNDKPLKEAFEQMLKVYKLKRRFDETALIAAWPEMMGQSVANRTKLIYIREKKLFLKLESSVVKNELMMIRTQIVEKLNERAGGTVLEDIVFL